MFDGLPETLNWLALCAIFGAAYVAHAFTAERKWPRWASLLSALLAFVVTATTLFFLYGATGFPSWMRWPTDLLANSAHAQLFVRPGFYSINPTGWQHNTTPDGDVFTCSICGAQVQVQIDYGPELTKEAQYKTNREFIAALGTDTAQKEFADSIIRQSIPLQSGFTISIERVGLSQIGGLDVLQFYGVVGIPPTISHDLSMLGIHKNRIMKITLNYSDGAFNEKTQSATHELYESLHFF